MEPKRYCPDDCIWRFEGRYMLKDFLQWRGIERPVWPLHGEQTFHQFCTFVSVKRKTQTTEAHLGNLHQNKVRRVPEAR